MSSTVAIPRRRFELKEVSMSQSTQATQKQRFLQLSTPLGDDALLLNSFTGREEMSRPFVFHLDMLSHDERIQPEALVGKDVTITLKYEGDGAKPKHFSGFISRFTAGSRESGFRRYHAEMVPWLWFLTRTSDCRIFDHLSVPEIVERVFTDFGFSEFEVGEIKEEHPELKYCVQYRETAFNFVSRLLEQEGIFYYFRHDNGKHTMVLADQPGAYKDLEPKTVELDYTFDSVERVERLTSFEHDYEFTSGRWAQTDYSFVNFPARSSAHPSNYLKTEANSVVGWHGAKKYEMFDYPGEYKEGEVGKKYTKTRMEEEEMAHDRVRGAGSCHSFAIGGKFELVKHDCRGEENKKYVLTSIQHSASEPSSYMGNGSGGGGYSNSFIAIPDHVPFRPARITPKPVVHGTQTAVVVGPKGEEIYTDKYGRVRVQFFWDRRNQRDENSSRWIRVSQPSAGMGWGSMFIPRVGQEVVVSYLEGDPDHPLITGVVYNAEQMPAYQLPENKTMSYMKTNSSEGGDGYNELRFEDKKDKEQIFIHAERNLDVRVKNDSFERVVNDRHLVVGIEKDGKGKGSQYEMVYGDQHNAVNGFQREYVRGNVDVRIGDDDSEDPPSNRQTQITGDDRTAIQGKQTLEVGEDSQRIIFGSDSETVRLDKKVLVNKNYDFEAKEVVTFKAGQTLVIEAGQQISFKVGGHFVDISSAGVAISGKMVMLNSGGKPADGAAIVDPKVPAEIKPPYPEAAKKADKSKSGKKSAPDSLN